MSSKDFVNQPEIIRQVAEETGEDRRDVEYVIERFFDIVRDLLIDGQTVKLTGLFKIAVIECKGRNGLNNFGKSAFKKPYKKIKTTITNSLRDKLNDGYYCEDTVSINDDTEDKDEEEND